MDDAWSKSRLMKTAFIFPGQGSQYVGMGKALAEVYPIARETFQEANEITGRSIQEICYEGPVEQLKQTENTQVAILTVSVATWRILRQYGEQPSVVAGHSLGEYAALVASEVMTFKDALYVVQQRADLMAGAAMEREGGMVAILGLNAEQVQAVCKRTAEYGFVQIANINSPAQVVVSGEADILPYAIEFGLEAGAKRCIPLRVSGAFHSALMAPAAQILHSVLGRLTFAEPRIPFIANVTGDYVSDAGQFRALLTEQVTGAVQWEKTIRRMWRDGIRYFVEVGPGGVLSGLVKRTIPEAQVLGIETPEDVSTYLETRHETQE